MHELLPLVLLDAPADGTGEAGDNGDPANADDSPNAPDESGTVAPRGNYFVH